MKVMIYMVGEGILLLDSHPEESLNIIRLDPFLHHTERRGMLGILRIDLVLTILWPMNLLFLNQIK